MWLLLLACTPTEPAPSGRNVASTKAPVVEPEPPPPDEAEPAPIVLELPAPPDPLVLELSRDDVDELLGPISTELTLLELDPDVLLVAALERIRAACGDLWTLDEPEWDCELTPLGQSLGPDAQSTPAFALVRLLGMTPGNAVVTDTSLEGVAGIADALGVGGGFGPVLADTLDRPLDAPAVATGALAAALREGLLATHPATTSDGRVPVTLDDVLRDLAPLATTLGPAGGHPGIVDPNAPTFGRVLDDDFAMSLVADSNLRILDGIDLSEGKGFFVTSTDELPLDLDFADPARFALTGLVDAPTVDLTLDLVESPERTVACTADPACWNNLPGQPVNPDSVWQLAPYTLESVIADAARREHQGRVFETTYTFLLFIPAVTVGMGQSGSPGGFLSFDVLADLGDPPDEQYVWELLLEVAEQNLHVHETYAFDEGDANPSFTLQDLPTGLTADDVEAAVRDSLAAQSHTVAQALLGNYADNSDPVDLVFDRTADGDAALLVVDLPGLFGDPELTRRVSVPLGEREGFVPPEGRTVLYTEDGTGTRYRVTVETPTEATLAVWVEEAP
ncbi:MAG: hypothetical protein AAF602_15615 [Myxococcota bacterium]